MNNTQISKKQKQVAQRLLDARIKRGLSQAETADRAGIDRKTVNRIENNHFSPSLNTIFRLCDVLAVKPKELVK